MHCKCTGTTVQFSNVFATGKIKYDLTKEKKFTYKAPVVPSKKKNFIPYTIFLDSISIFQTFFQVWKIALQITRLFQDVKTLYEQCFTDSCSDFTQS